MRRSQAYNDETDRAEWLVRYTGCGISLRNPIPDYCQRCGFPILGMVGGMGGYICFRALAPEFPIDPLPITLAISGVLYLIGAYLGPPPRREALVKFWGTQEEIERIVGAQAPEVGMARRT
jgi:hypothetical protein